MQSLVTKYGELIPQHTSDDLRKRDIIPVTYHENGQLKSVPLETQTTIATTVGEIPAELVSFHENGELNRIFPLNGKLSGYWGEADEMALAKPVTVTTPVGDITARFISLAFYDTGALRSVTIFPGDTVKIDTPLGFFETRIGISFTPEGILESLEPAKPTPIKTPLGEVMVFDPDAVGVNGDANSLTFDAEGTVTGFITTLTQFKVVQANGSTTMFTPGTRESLCGTSDEEMVPMIVRIADGFAAFQLIPETPFQKVPMEDSVFFATPFLGAKAFQPFNAGCAI